MKNVRIWFKKESECKYISHLDLNRCMARAVRRAQLPIWHTEGFNPHPFITFPLPISLGISGINECMDIRIIDDNFDIRQIVEKMNQFLPSGITVFNATYPVYDPKYIYYAEFYAEFSSDDMPSESLYSKIIELHNLDAVIIQKKSKAGMKDVDVLPYIKDFRFENSRENCCSFKVTLPAGNTKNIGLPLILKAIENHLNIEINYNIVKLDMFTEEMSRFE